MEGTIREKCLYCNSEIFYTRGIELVKCASCGQTNVVAQFQSEQLKLEAALKEGEQAKKALDIARREKEEAQERLNQAVAALEDIQSSQKGGEKKLEKILSGMEEDEKAQAAMRGLMEALRGQQKKGQDTLSNLMRALSQGQEGADRKLELLQAVSQKILSSEDDILAKLGMQQEIVQLLQSMQMKGQEIGSLTKDFYTWSQSIRAEDVERLKGIQTASGVLLDGQKEISGKVDALQKTADETQELLKDFQGEYQADKLKKLDNLYRQAESLQRDRSFDKAADFYRQVVTEGGGGAEVYWRLVMCHYCMEYQRDDEDNFIPIILYPDLTDPASMSVRSNLIGSLTPGPVEDHYRGELRKIDRILDGYREIHTQVRYDVFISVKQSWEGHYTTDSDVASELYDYLTGKGLRVFNSRRTAIPAGKEFEPYIISALLSAKALIVVGTRPEFMNAQWVRNEWSRFQWLQKHEREKTGATERVLFCYLSGGMKPGQIPKALNPDRQAILDGLNAHESLDVSLAFLIPKASVTPTPQPRPTPPPTPGEDPDAVSTQMMAMLYSGQFEQVWGKYTELLKKGQFLTMQLPLYALCAQKQVAEIEQVADSTANLAAENLFKLARRMARTEQEKEYLGKLLRRNEEYRSQKEDNLSNALARVSALLAEGGFEQAKKEYAALAEREPFKGSSQLHLLGLCAEKSAAAPEQLAKSENVTLEHEPLFVIARQTARTTSEHKRLDELLRLNEEARKPKPDALQNELNMLGGMLYTGKYENAYKEYERVADQEPYAGSVWLHLYGMCAGCRVVRPELAAQSERELAADPRFQRAQKAAKKAADKKIVADLLKMNQTFRQNNAVKAEIERIQALLSAGKYVEAFSLYSKYSNREPHKGSAMWHLYGMCAGQKAASPEDAARQMYDLEENIWFEKARRCAGSDEEREQLSHLLTINREYRATENAKLQETLNNYKVFLSVQNYAEVTRSYQLLSNREPYRSHVSMHLYALCAQLKKGDIHQVALSMTDLENEPLFQKAQAAAKSDADEKQLEKLLADNRKYRADHNVTVDAVLRRMRDWLKEGEYDLVTQEYNRLAAAGQFQDNPWIHLNALAAQKRAVNILDIASQLDYDHEPLFLRAERSKLTEEDTYILHALRMAAQQPAGDKKCDVFITQPPKDAYGNSTSAESVAVKELTTYLAERKLEAYVEGEGNAAQKLAAIRSARLLIVVAGSRDAAQKGSTRATWVKFQQLQQEDVDKGGKTDRYILCYLTGDMKANQLPADLNVWQVITHGAHAHAALNAALDRLGMGGSAPAPEPARPAVIGQAELKEMSEMLKMGLYDKTVEKYDQLRSQPSRKPCMQLHLLGLCAQKRASDIGQVIHSSAKLEEEPLIEQAMREASPPETRTLEDYIRENRRFRQKREEEEKQAEAERNDQEKRKREKEIDQSKKRYTPLPEKRIIDFWLMYLPSIHNSAVAGGAVSEKMSNTVLERVGLSLYGGEFVVGYVSASRGLFQGYATIVVTNFRIAINMNEQVYPRIVAEYKDIRQAAAVPLNTNPKKKTLALALKNGAKLSVGNPSNAMKDVFDFSSLANVINDLVSRTNS